MKNNENYMKLYENYMKMCAVFSLQFFESLDVYDGIIDVRFQKKYKLLNRVDYL